MMQQVVAVSSLLFPAFSHGPGRLFLAGVRTIFSALICVHQPTAAVVPVLVLVLVPLSYSKLEIPVQQQRTPRMYYDIILIGLYNNSSTRMSEKVVTFHVYEYIPSASISA